MLLERFLHLRYFFYFYHFTLQWWHFRKKERKKKKPNTFISFVWSLGGSCRHGCLLIPVMLGSPFLIWPLPHILIAGQCWCRFLQFWKFKVCRFLFSPSPPWQSFILYQLSPSLYLNTYPPSTFTPSVSPWKIREVKIAHQGLKNV